MFYAVLLTSAARATTMTGTATGRMYESVGIYIFKILKISYSVEILNREILISSQPARRTLKKQNDAQILMMHNPQFLLFCPRLQDDCTKRIILFLHRNTSH